MTVDSTSSAWKPPEWVTRVLMAIWFVLLLGMPAPYGIAGGAARCEGDRSCPQDPSTGRPGPFLGTGQGWQDLRSQPSPSAACTWSGSVCPALPWRPESFSRADCSPT